MADKGHLPGSWAHSLSSQGSNEVDEHWAHTWPRPVSAGCREEEEGPQTGEKVPQMHPTASLQSPEPAPGLPRLLLAVRKGKVPDFYHICICKIDEITPLKRTAFLSPKQQYTFQIPPRRSASSLPSTGVPPAGTRVALSAWAAVPRDRRALQSRAAVWFQGLCGWTEALPFSHRPTAVPWSCYGSGTKPCGGNRIGSQASQAGRAREMDGRLRGVPGTLGISHSSLCSPEGPSGQTQQPKLLLGHLHPGSVFAGGGGLDPPCRGGQAGRRCSVSHPGSALPWGFRSKAAKVSKSSSGAAMLEENAEAVGTHTAGRGDTSGQAQPDASVLVGKSREKSGMPPRARRGPPGLGAGLRAERSLSCIAPAVWWVWEPDYREWSAPRERNKLGSAHLAAPRDVSKMSPRVTVSLPSSSGVAS
ncbi:uncharacterized protein LOC142416853 [Mycteria americana]|uniref:uncharacterized protein LOC142416853 n=1 Tax=Mycteria americana TaxID=33587 RepID=UPI003F588131